MQVVEGTATQLRRGVLEYCTLALIEQGPTYGLAVAHALHQQGLLESEGTLYPLLTRLRRRYLVTSEWAESPTGPHRRYYRLTESGRAALRTFRTDWIEFTRAVNSLLEGDPGVEDD